MLREIKKELVDYISRNTGIDKETVVKVLRAEEAFFVLQLEKALGENGRNE